jgi:hypothetical protein
LIKASIKDGPVQGYVLPSALDYFLWMHVQVWWQLGAQYGDNQVVRESKDSRPFRSLSTWFAAFKVKSCLKMIQPKAIHHPRLVSSLSGCLFSLVAWECPRSRQIFSRIN